MKLLNLLFLVTLFKILFIQQAISQNVISTFDSIIKNNAMEKVYLHIDRSFYKIDEEIWYKVYLLDAHTHKQEALSSIAYVDFIDNKNKLIETQTIKLFKGSGNGSFTIPTNLESGEYTIRAYTNYMRNFDQSLFFRKKIYVKSNRVNDLSMGSLKTKINKNDELAKVGFFKPDVQFFPEGGHMIVGFLNNTGFKAMGNNGKGIEVSGVILNGRGTEVLEFDTVNFGMGVFKFIPQENESYKARISHEGRTYIYDLPTPLVEGVALNITDHKEFYKVVIQSSKGYSLNDFKLFGLQRGGIVFSSMLSGNKTQALIKVPKTAVEEGIIQFTLLDDNNLPICERLVFYEVDKENNIVTLSASRGTFEKRELVELDVVLDSSISQKSKTNMSLVVTQNSVLSPQNTSSDINSYMLLQSELKGPIEHIGYYFNSSDTLRKQNLDLLMLTQGWRQYILNDVTENKESDNVFFPEEGITLSGYVKKAYNHKEPAMAEVSLAYNNEETFGYGAIKTDANGRFIFKNLKFEDTTSIVLHAKRIEASNKKNKQDRKNTFYIERDTLKTSKLLGKQNVNNVLKETETIFNYTNRADSDFTFDPAFVIDSETIILDEAMVTVVKPRTVDRFKEKHFLYTSTSHTLDFSDEKLLGIPRDPLDALKVFGIYFKDDGNVLLRGRNTSTKFLLNGFPSDYDAIRFLPVSSIDFIDVLKGNRAVRYGVKSVIAVYTKDGSEPKEEHSDPGMVKFVHPGYNVSKKFYQPKYSIKQPEHSNPDKRITLAWKPNIEFDKKGHASISFYTADVSAKYKVSLQGVTEEGKPLVSEITFDVK